jgi:hypothetical protein
MIFAASMGLKGWVLVLLYTVITLDLAKPFHFKLYDTLANKIFASTKPTSHLHSYRDPIDFRNMNLKKNIPSLNSTDILLSRRRNTWWPFKGSLSAEIPEYLDGE